MAKTWAEVQEEQTLKARAADIARAERFAAQREEAARKAAKGRPHGASYFRRDGSFVLGNDD